MTQLLFSREILRLSARVLATMASMVFVFLALTEGPPLRPEGPGLEQDLQYALVGAGVFVTIVSLFSPAIGGALMVFVGMVLGAAAAGSYTPETALVVALL
jgi:hypothetical protein